MYKRQILQLDENHVPFLIQKEEKESKRICPKCKKGEILKGKNAFGCSLYQEGCHTIIPFEFLGKKLTDNQIDSLINKGVTPLIKGFVQNDQKINGKLTFDENFKIIIKIEK